MPDPVQLMGKLGLDSDVNPIQAGVMRALAEKFRSAAARGTGIARRGDVFVLRDMRLGFENVEKAALALSAQVAQAVLFAAVFDEDVYLFGVCKGGTLLGKDVDGEGLAAYGLQQQCMPRRRCLPSWAADMRPNAPACTGKRWRRRLLGR